jgi:hypothetical protein
MTHSALVGLLIVLVEGETFKATPPAGTPGFVVVLILLARHAAYAADCENRMKRVPTRSQPIGPRSFHVLADLWSLRSYSASSSARRPLSVSV